MMKSKTTAIRATSKMNLHRQQGSMSIQTIVALAVGALALVGGVGAYIYIDQQKSNNDMEELGQIRSGLVDYGQKHNTSFAALTLDIGCRQSVFPANRCTGSGAGTAVSNAWGGSYAITATNVLGGTNNGGRLQSTLVSDSSCVKEITYLWDQWAKIEVGATTVKSLPTDQLNDTTVNSACNGGSNTIYWTVKG